MDYYSKVKRNIDDQGRVCIYIPDVVDAIIRLQNVCMRHDLNPVLDFMKTGHQTECLETNAWILVVLNDIRNFILEGKNSWETHQVHS